MGEAIVMRVIHSAVPGRVRLHVPSIKRTPEAAGSLRGLLLEVAGIGTVQASAITGNLLIPFDPSRHTARTVARHVASLCGRDGPFAPGPGPQALPGDDLSSAMPAVDRPQGGEAVPAVYRWSASAPVDEVLGSLGVPDADGLPEEEVRRRAVALGKRTVELSARRPAAAILREQFVSLPTSLLAAAMGISLLTAGRLDAAVIGAVLALNGLIGYVTERYAEGAVAALRRLGYPRARVIRAGSHRIVTAEDLVPGDVVRLRAGDLVPGDARVIEGTLLVNEALLTGESEPVSKHALPTTAPRHLYEFRNVLFQGTAALDGRARAVVLTTGRDTELGRIQSLVMHAVPPRTPLQHELDRLGKTLGIGAAAVCGVLFGLGIARGQAALPMLQMSVPLGVAAVPEGLPALATTALAIGMGRMLQHEVIIRKLPAVEALGSVTVLCVDKTGTLTLNRMTASHYWWEGQVFPCVDSGVASIEAELPAGERVASPPHPALDAMLRLGVLCSEAKLRRENGGLHVSGSPTEGALLLAASAAGCWFEDVRDAYPLLEMHRRDEHHLWMASLHRAPAGGLLVAVKGAPGAVLALCGYRFDGTGGQQPLSAADRERYRTANQRMAEEGLRVLAFAQGHAHEEAVDLHDRLRDLTWLGMVGLQDPLRSGVLAAIRRCRRAGVRTVILTGDQRATALAVARLLELDEAHADVREAPDLLAHSPDEIAQIVARTAVFARVSPAAKLRIVQALQARGEVVAMTGDGVNDGPALKAADIGIAMGEESSDVARELADVVLGRNDFGALVAAVEQGRVLFANIRRAVRYLVATNIAELMLAAATLLSGIPFPFLPTQLLWLNLVSDVFPALALVLEPSDQDVMRQPPRPPGTPLIGGREWRGLCGDAAAMAGGTLGAYLWAARRHGYGARASALAMTSLTFGEAGYALACRGRTERPGGTPHRALWGSLAGTAGLQLALNHWAPLRRLLHGAPLGTRPPPPPPSPGPRSGAAAGPSLNARPLQQDYRARELGRSLEGSFRIQGFGGRPGGFTISPRGGAGAGTGGGVSRGGRR